MPSQKYQQTVARLTAPQNRLIHELLQADGIAAPCRRAGVTMDDFHAWVTRDSAFRVQFFHMVSVNQELGRVDFHKPAEVGLDHAQPDIPETITVSWYRPEHYAQLREVLADGQYLPATYEEWLAEAEASFRFSRMFPVTKVYIDPWAFPRWCATYGMPTDALSRVLFAAAWLTRRSHPNALSEFGLSFRLIGRELIWADRDREGVSKSFNACLERVSEEQQMVLQNLNRGAGDLECLASLEGGRDTWVDWFGNADFVALVMHLRSMREEQHFLEGSPDPRDYVDYTDREAPETMTFSWYRREDYAKLRRLMKDGGQLPELYDEWLAAEQAIYDGYVTAGFPAVQVTIDANAYPAWCRRHGYPMTAQTRVIYAAEWVTTGTRASAAKVN